MSKTLFQISDDLLAIDALLDEMEGDITNPEAEAAIDQWFAELGTERNAKLESYGYLIKELEARASGIKEEVARLRARQQASENKAERLKARLEVFFQLHNIDKIATTAFTFAMQNPGGKPKVQLRDEFAENPVELPEGYRRVKFEADLISLREALEAGDETAQQYAYIVPPIKRLRIR